MPNKQISNLPWGRIGGLMAAIVLTATAATALVQLNPFALSDDLRVVADETFQSQITQSTIWLLAARAALEVCQASGQNCSSQIRDVATLEAEISRLVALKKKHGN